MQLDINVMHENAIIYKSTWYVDEKEYECANLAMGVVVC